MSNLSKRHEFLTFICDYNPFYLLSALCMFGACWGFSHALDMQVGDVSKIIWLIGVLTLYEALVIGLAIYLVRRHGLARDALILLLIETVFITDATFLFAECFTIDADAGMWINAVGLLLTVVKLFVLIRLMKLRFNAADLLALGAVLVLLFALPGWLSVKPGDGGALTPKDFYHWSWIIAAIPVLHLLLSSWWRKSVCPDAIDIRFDQRARSFLLYIPFLLLVVRLCELLWVHKVGNDLVYIMPIGLAVVVWLTRLHPAGAPNMVLARWQFALLGLVTVCQFGGPYDLVYDVSWWGEGVVTPFRCAMMGGAAGLLIMFAYLRLISVMIAAAVFITSGLFGATPSVAIENIINLLEALGRNVRKLLPTKPAHWGIVAIVGAFVMLGLGAVVSLARSRILPADEPEDEQTPPSSTVHE